MENPSVVKKDHPKEFADCDCVCHTPDNELQMMTCAPCCRCEEVKNYNYHRKNCACLSCQSK